MKKLSIAVAATAAMLTSLGAQAAVNPMLLGSSDTAADADRTVVIQPGTHWVNVNYDEVVNFVDQGREFAIRFDGVRSAFDLGALAPAGALDHPVRVYVAPHADASY